jgi:hypothetical protein
LPRRFAPRNDVDRSGYDFAFSRRDAPGVLLETLPTENQRAQGRPGARCTRGLAGVLQRNMLPTSIQVQRRAPGLPCAMALRLIRDRPGDPAFCDTIVLGRRWLPSNLTPASGRRTQTISPYAKAALVFAALASTASHPALVTIAKRPPSGTGRAICSADLGSASRKIRIIRSFTAVHLRAPATR